MTFKSILSTLVLVGAALILSQNIFAGDDVAEKPAKEKVEKKEKKAKVALEDLSHTGVVEEKKNKKRNTFYLKTAAGKIRLPVSPKKSKNPIVLANYVGKNVTVTGKGFIKVRKTKKGESKKVHYKKILSVKEATEVKAEEKK